MENLLDHIKAYFRNSVSIKEKRPVIYQLLLPLYHEDGDMVDLFIVPVGDGRYELCDFGMTLMRLSYTYEIDSEPKEKVLQRILTENRLVEEDGNIKFETKETTILTDIMHITQAYAKIASMRYFKREVIEGMFYQILDEFIINFLQDYKPQKEVLPIPERYELEADYQITPNGLPFYLFGVKDATKAKLATISCLEYQKSKLSFRSIIVHDDLDRLPKKDRNLLINACDKQSTSLAEFKQNAVEYFERERGAYHKLSD